MKKQEVDININISVSTDRPKTSSHEIAEKEINEKLRVSLSVAQLAYLSRILSEIGVIKNRNVSEVIRFFVKNLSTPKAETISFDSFKTKYYNVDHATKQIYYDFLVKKLNFIRKDLKI